MHPVIIIGTVRSLIVDVAMGQIPRSTERISSYIKFSLNFVAEVCMFIDYYNDVNRDSRKVHCK